MKVLEHCGGEELANYKCDLKSFAKLKGPCKINYGKHAAGTVRCIGIILASSPPAGPGQLYDFG